jgi:eukaryotic-like serine/threonine-protein kinase
LPLTDVAEAQLLAAAQSSDMFQQELSKCIAHAEPLLHGNNSQTAFLLHPGTETSQQLAAEVQRCLPAVHLLSGSSPHDLTFCREQGFLSHADLQPLLPLCRNAYRAQANSPPHSPHARFDVAEWLPLEP